MNKNFFPIVITVLLLFAAIFAVTQESQASFSVNNLSRQTPDFIKPPRWFRSNQGGMAIEEVSSSLIALRNDYALSIEFTGSGELPQSLVPFYNDNFFVEVRTLYEEGFQIRKQWIFRDINGTTRLNAVMVESPQNGNEKRRTGFMEIYDESSFLITEYDFFDNGENIRTDYEYNNGILINITVSVLKEGEYRKSYGDFFKYNRSLFLRAVERVFYKDASLSLSDESLLVSFPRNIADAAEPHNLTGENISSYPDFFGEVHIEGDNKIVYTTDERGRILTQTLYDEDETVIWVIQNTWLNDRIITTVKTEDDTEYLAEFEYDSGGERILEKNYKNGILERLVRIDGKTETEDLYLNGVVVLRAVWEDGRKISETRVNSR